ncbi:MAG: SDR family NAD(P)-dependent oxidoreductase [Caulobacteraceae bacterium]|nr:SDR family NAD(P)-dependent oxidoreductase [Caulobacteraceae bacterium]
MERGQFAGRTALVTGAGRGIGRAHARLLAQLGASVLVCDVGAALDGRGRDVAVAEAVAEEIRAAGRAAAADAGDISSFAGGGAAVARTIEAFGRIDIVVNNAGLGGGGGDVEALQESEVKRVFDVNFYGALGVARAAWPHLKAQGWGRIINTVSEVALDSKMPSAGVSYGAAKAAVWSMTLSLAREGAPHGITVNALSPGAFTRMNEALFAAQGRPALDLDPAHVARVAAWLCSEEASDVTGRIIHAAGGQHREYLTGRRKDTELTARVDAGVRAVMAAALRTQPNG